VSALFPPPLSLPRPLSPTLLHLSTRQLEILQKQASKPSALPSLYHHLSSGIDCPTHARIHITRKLLLWHQSASITLKAGLCPEVSSTRQRTFRQETETSEIPSHVESLQATRKSNRWPDPQEISNPSYVRLTPGFQHDCHEYFMAVVNMLHEINDHDIDEIE
jgi:hypothetical protein